MSTPEHGPDEERQRLDDLYREVSKTCYMTFVRGLVIGSAVGKAQFDQIMGDFQRDCFQELADNLEPLQRGEIPEKRRFWIERTKKASKDTDMATVAVWLIAFTNRPFSIQVCAANRKQAGILKERIEAILFYNEWLNEFIESHQGGYRSIRHPKIVNLAIEATDSTGGAHGGLPDLLILNELTHVAKWRAMDDHRANADGNPRGMVCIVTNAGIKGTPAHVWRKAAMEEPDRWAVHVWDRPSPWASLEDVAEAKKRDPIGAEYARLWEGKWTSGTGDAVTEAEIDALFKLNGPIFEPEPGWWYVGGLDLGISHDHAGVALIGINEFEGRIRIAQIKAWEPSIPNDKGKLEVDVEAVERFVVNAFHIFNIQWFGYDPAAGGSFLAQRLRKQNVPMAEMNFSSNTAMTDMAQSFVQCVKDGVLEAYEDEEGRIRRDFGKFSIVRKIPAGYKLEAVSDEFGHADVGTAIVITLPYAKQLLEGHDRLRKDDDLVYDDDEPLTDEEIENLPDDLRDIIDGYAAMYDEYDVTGGFTGKSTADDLRNL